jgi:LCP family protein required for cell wall assembly
LPGITPQKLNAIYARRSDRAEGAALLMNTMENMFHVKIDAYASVDFGSFEAIIDRLGGVEIEISKTEASYLNRTNYISNPAYRTVKEGWNTLNGNQAVGYCRVRHVATIGGANDDLGRALRQRKVLRALFEKYKSKNILELMSIAEFCLGEMRSDITSGQISDLLKTFMEIGISGDPVQDRIPASNYFEENGRDGYGGVTYAVFVDLEKNTKYLFEKIFGDTPEEAEEHYRQYIDMDSTYGQYR